MTAPRVVIAGAGQVTQHKGHEGPLRDPVALMAEAARAAARDAGSERWLTGIDALWVVRPLSRHLPEAPAALASALGATPRACLLSGIGGHTPQLLVHRAASLVAAGACDSVLIVGGECFYPRSPDAVRGEGAIVQGVPASYRDDDLVGATPQEARHGMSMPIHGFPLYETAAWAASGLPLAAHLANVGALWSRFSTVAAHNPHAWTRTPLAAAGIVTPDSANRMICFPYTKRMTSLVTVDMAAAVLVASEAGAARTRPSGRRPVYFRGGGYAVDRQRFHIQKRDWLTSPPLARAAECALGRAGLALDAVASIDLYSCFPSAVQVAQRTLGLHVDDPRPLTVTGGLGFFGGPGSNYALHSIATMTEQIAGGRTPSGLITALGWFMHKQAVGLYAAEPGTRDCAGDAPRDEAMPLTDEPPVGVADGSAGPGLVETYTVVHDRQGRPLRGIVYGRTVQRARFVANVAADDPLIERMQRECLVGEVVRLRREGELTLATGERP